MRNKKGGMKECKFTPNLKFLIENFKMAYHFFLIYNFLKCVSVFRSDISTSLLLIKGRIFYSVISEMNYILAFFFSAYYDFYGYSMYSFFPHFFYHNQFLRLK